MSESNAENNRFAQMNGVVIEEKQSPQFVQEPPPEPEEVITSRQTWQKPLPKAVLIGSGVFVVVAFFGVMVNSTIVTINSSTQSKQQPQKETSTLEEQFSKEESSGQMKTDIALTTQKGELASLNELGNQHKSTPVTLSQSHPMNQKLPQKIAAVPVVTSPPSKPIPKPVTPPPSSIPTPKPVTPPPPSKPIPKPVTPPPSSRPSLVPIPNSSIDPMQQWLAAANVGNLNLGGNDSDTASVTSQQLPTGGIGVQTVSKNPIGKGTDELTQNTDYSNKQVLVGSRASGILETPIAWSATGNNTEQKYLIRLTQPLLASDNSVVVPTDSYIVADFKAANLSEFVQLTAISVIVNEGNKTIEKPLTENSVLILGKEGKALRGQAKKGSTLGEDFTASILSGISKAADTLNSSEHTISVNGSTTIVNSNSNHNIAAGFASGTTQEMVRRMQASNQQRLQELKSEPKVYLIEKGTLVQIFVNQSVLL